MLLSAGRILLMFQFALLAGYTAAKIVSLPHQRYVLEGHGAVVRCQNRSDTESIFYYYITSALWYRDYQNGTVIQIGSSGVVFAHKHTLRFSTAVTTADEGVYFCCVPKGACGSSSSAFTIMQISTAPVIVAKIPKYTITPGSPVMLTCEIVDRGMPPAKFGWKKDGYELHNDYLVSINGSFVTLTLTDVTMENAGLYVCTATGTLSYRTDHVELIIEGIASNVTINKNHMPYIVYLQSKELKCQHTELKEYLNEALKVYSTQICNCTNYTVKVECNITGAGSVYTVQLDGPMAGNILQSWLKNEQNGNSKIDIGSDIFVFCNQTCTEIIADNNESESSFIPIVLTGIIIIIMSFALLVTLIVSIGYCLCRKKMYDNVKSINASNKVFVDGVTQVDKAPANYNKLQCSENYSIKSSTKEFTQLNAKYNDVDNRKAASKAMTVEDIVNPPVWNVDTNSVAFMVHTKL